MDYDKLNKRIDHMFKYETDNFFANINLKNEVANKLYDYQFLHIFNLMTAIRYNNVILDTSSVGLGKTYTSIGLCLQLNLRPFIICPKTVMPQWNHVCKIFGVRPLGIVNYESIKNGKYYNKTGERVNCNFVKVVEDGKKLDFQWNLPGYALIIFDEVHKCKNQKTQNAKLLLSTKNQRRVLMLSATLSDKPNNFQIFGYMLGCYKKINQAKNWINGMLFEDKMHIGSKENYISALNRFLYPDKGSRMRIEDLKGKFPENQISVENYYIEESERDKINEALINIKTANDLTKTLRERQLIEKTKIPIFEELAKDYNENGFNVAIFVNFIDTIHELSKRLKTNCIIYGDQTDQQRQKNIDRFQNNESNIIIVSATIVEGIGLHDIFGVPRVSLISPNYSSQNLLQIFGRIHRAGSKTPALQRVITCADTLEENICNHLNKKIHFLNTINDNDLLDIS
ncbi:DEAD/SNF2-like helicase [Klosneuvirus KNV1]|uniref:DEAD/SNF2-like helicase n=1 Tax=Klosneuvirus KNV1 TaxID=1977640 RepID=A0A1V0SJ51_9VIRU|nr:DEAD/SNF2-like helicase [Klosneuvirus KNV1]